MKSNRKTHTTGFPIIERPSPEGVACAPTHCPSCKVAIGNPKAAWCRLCGADLSPSTAESVKVLPSPSVVPVEVPTKEGKPLESTYTDSKVTFLSRGGETVAKLDGRNHRKNAREIVTACNSHAAHLAKIQALTDRNAELLSALECAHRDLSMTYTALKSGTPAVSIGQWGRLESVGNVIAAERAALALPTA